ncbi:hypothetical protein C2I27_19345 [Priestia megaterium]|uniref:hypothetical protein n=1 Tax=Priestia TaxID=2800373 RepID=UPI000D5235CD|nr:hypothetical protein [Priestia megaterium]MBU8852921.1 hypothetical protein [Bacillus sp. FJAT-26377]PVC65467.1 hypothetical protein C2I27_19345 [Priestia megaterium]
MRYEEIEIGETLRLPTEKNAVLNLVTVINKVPEVINGNIYNVIHYQYYDESNHINYGIQDASYFRVLSNERNPPCWHCKREIRFRHENTSQCKTCGWLNCPYCGECKQHCTARRKDVK